jgi:membrane protein
MEIFQTIWTALTTPNRWLTNIIITPLTFLEATVSMLLFTTVLNLSATKKRKLFYIVVLSLWSIILNIILPKQIASIINMILLPIFIYFVFHTTVLKAILSEVIPTICIVLVESLISKFFFVIFNMSYETALSTPLFRLAIMISVYTLIFVIYLIYKKLKFSKLVIPDIFDRKSKILLICNFILALISMGAQIYLITFYNDKLPFMIVLLSLISLVSYFVISIFSLIRTTQLEITTRDLEQTKQYNRTLSILHDNIRAFRHDFQNIVQTIGRICSIRRYERIKSILFSASR